MKKSSRDRRIAHMMQELSLPKPGEKAGMMIRDLVQKLLAQRPDIPPAVLHATILDYYELFNLPVREGDIAQLVQLMDEALTCKAGTLLDKVDLSKLSEVPAKQPVLRCSCTFIAPGVPMNSTLCDIHENKMYKCDVRGCLCTDYRPLTAPIDNPPGSVSGQRSWSICSCGHIAQEHN